MNNPTQHRNWIFGTRGRAESAALALAIMLAAAVLATGSAQAQTLTTLHSFDGTDGASPYAALVQATDGNLYGTTLYGGPNSCSYPGIGTIFSCGTVFKITPSGTLATLYSFCSQSGCTDGQFPDAGLIQATDGNFYGTTQLGGANGAGTVFKITPSGTLTTLHSFCSQSCTDGGAPYAGLVQGTDGNFYGTTFGGIANGTVFKITPSGTLTTIYTFCFGCTGANPYAGLVQATDGNFYGTTFFGGANGVGTVFEITPSGTLTTLYSFCPQSGCTDGANPYAALVQAANGDLYGTTEYGNSSGTVFEITPSGTLTSLQAFNGPNGASPYAGLVQATDGNFYGTTEQGGANSCTLGSQDVGCGTIFKITPGGVLTTLHSFDGTDGEYPYAGLVQATDGNFYGTTSGGGANGDGTVFSLSVGLGPFVETQPTSGNVGATVEILGTNLTGATGVSFNGTAATFTVVSASLITTTVPAGATTGYVKVATPSGTLTSNVAFRVETLAATTTTLTSSPNPSAYGQAVIFTAGVTSSAGAPPNGEAVTFMEGTTVLGTGTLSGGSASFTTSTLPVGRNAIKAVYGGDSNFAGSTSNTVRQVVSKATTTTKLTSSPGPFVYKQQVTFIATVTSSAGAPPDGETVTFERGTAKLGTGTLSGGEASFTTSALPEGRDSVTAVYGGDANLAGSRSTIAISVVQPATVKVRGTLPVDFFPNPQFWYVNVTNHGPGVAYNVRLASATVNGIGGSASPPGDLGSLAKGESRTIKITGGGQLLIGFENVEIDTVTWIGGTSTFSIYFLVEAGP
jgi:uncharacterized repeat protein (TIGR03803 family)